MIRENAKKNIDIISAFAEGKTIQYKTDTGSWHDLTENEGLPMGTLSEEPNMFRIKPEPKCRPFANAEECWVEMLKHQPIGWVKRKGNEHYSLITDVDDIKYGISLNERSGFDMNYVWVNYTFADGTPFCVKVEERV